MHRELAEVPLSVIAFVYVINRKMFGKDKSWIYGACVLLLSKILLIPTYRSTDFEVHRNWMALTNSLPLSKWYYERTSQWTLDYPPLFAYFEFFLGILGGKLDPRMLEISASGYFSITTLIYQRASVMFCDVLMLIAFRRLFNCICKDSSRASFWTVLAICGNAALLIVDSIHFQYNSLVTWPVIVAIALLVEGRLPQACFIFTLALCLKHINIYYIPAFGVCLLEIVSRKWKRSGAGKGLYVLITSILMTVSVLVPSFLPFFNRGLVHAYWAPNFWVAYILTDKILGMAMSALGIAVNTCGPSSFTGGLVGSEPCLAVLPMPTARHCITLIAAATLPLLVVKNPTHHRRVCLTFSYSAVMFFLFGFHVHEKALLLVAIPLSVSAFTDERMVPLSLSLMIAAIHAQLPLLFEPQDFWLRSAVAAIYIVALFYALRERFNYRPGVLIKAQVLCIVMIEAYGKWGHGPMLNFLNKKGGLPFFPLLLVSAFDSVVVLACAFEMIRKLFSAL